MGAAIGSVEESTWSRAASVLVQLNRQAMERLAGEAALEIVPGATHLFEEPGTLEQVAGLARDWFLLHLRPVAHRVGQGTG